MVYKNGEIYEGEWANDKRNGKGVFTFPDDTSYIGEWKDDVF